MKNFTALFLLLFVNVYLANSQCTATITPSGPTTICQGDSIILSANRAKYKKAHFISSRNGGVAFGIGNKGYVGTGRDNALFLTVLI